MGKEKKRKERKALSALKLGEKKGRALLIEDEQIDTICLNLYGEITLRVRPLDTICLPMFDTICLH